MKSDDQVAITLVCFGCRAEQIMRIPRERGIRSGRYSWECFACQEKRYGVLGCGRKRYHKLESTSLVGNGQLKKEQEKT